MLNPEKIIWAITNYIPRHKEFGCTAMATTLGVPVSTLNKAIRGDTWKHLQAYCSELKGE